MISKKSMISLIFVVLLISVGIYFALTFNPTSEKNENKEVSNDIITIYDKEIDDLNKVSVILENEEFSFVKNDDLFVCEGREHIKLKNSVVDSLASDVSTLVAKEIISEKGNDLSEYGLKNPKATIKAYFNDEKIEILIGGQTTQSAYFAKLANDDKIFTLYSTRGDSFIKPLNDYRNMDVLGIDGQALIKFEVDNDGEKLIAQKVGADDKWNITSPIEKEADFSLLNEKIVSLISYFVATEYVDDTDSNLSKYGLKNPTKSVYIEDSFGNKQRFYFGDTQNGYCYVKLEGETGVFIMKENLNAIFDIKLIEIVDSFVYIPNINKVKQIDIAVNEGENHTLKINKIENEVEYKIDDVEVLEEKFKSIYQNIIGLRMSDFTFENVEGNPFCTIIYTLNDLTTTKLDFKLVTDRQAIVIKDGQTMGYIAKKYLNEMIMALEN